MTAKAIRQEGDREYLDGLVGLELSAVTFVRDYVQLEFDGPVISAFTPPTVTTEEGRVSYSQRGYRDALCERIGASVVSAVVQLKQQLKIDLSDGSSLEISLRREDREVEEAAVYRDKVTKEWTSW